MTALHKGFLVSIEGIDGSGKSTLATTLQQQCLSSGIPVTLTKEPGSSALGNHLRNMLHTQVIPMCPKAQALLFSADRAQHVQDIVQPALAAGNVVISDRMVDSSLAYQGFGNGLDLETLRAINSWTMNTIVPDLVIYLEISVEKALERVNKRGDVGFYEKKDFLERVHKGFEELFKDRENVVRISATQTAQAVAKQAFDHLHIWLNNKVHLAPR